MKKRNCIIAAALVTAIFGGSFFFEREALFASAQEKAATKEVSIDNFSFSPATLTVSAGTRITWTNRDDIPHTVVSTDKIFKSNVLDTNDKFSYTFDKR